MSSAPVLFVTPGRVYAGLVGMVDIQYHPGGRCTAIVFIYHTRQVQFRALVVVVGKGVFTFKLFKRNRGLKDGFTSLAGATNPLIIFGFLLAGLGAALKTAAKQEHNRYEVVHVSG